MLVQMKRSNPSPKEGVGDISFDSDAENFSSLNCIVRTSSFITF